MSAEAQKFAANVAAIGNNIDQLRLAAQTNAETVRNQQQHIHELETALNRMVLAHENLEADTEGRWPERDSGCIECTCGTVPDRLNTGLCAYHSAKKLLRHV